jgi:hypothetical protein
VQLRFRRLFSEDDLIVHYQIRRMADVEFLNQIGTLFHETGAVRNSQLMELFFQNFTVRTGLRGNDHYIHGYLQKNFVSRSVYTLLTFHVVHHAHLFVHVLRIFHRILQK